MTDKLKALIAAHPNITLFVAGMLTMGVIVWLF